MYAVVGGSLAESSARQHEGDCSTRDARSGRVVRRETARGLGLRAARPGRTLRRTDLVDRRNQSRLPPTWRRLRKFSQGFQQEAGACVCLTVATAVILLVGISVYICCPFLVESVETRLLEDVSLKRKKYIDVDACVVINKCIGDDRRSLCCRSSAAT